MDRQITIIFVATLCVFSATSTEKYDTDPLCSQACGSPMNESYVSHFCEESGLQLDGRCCLNKTQVVGIDLQKCGFPKLNTIFENLSSLQIILLQENPLSNLTSSDFGGLLHIDYLALSPDLSCPGGSESWDSENMTSTETLCLMELDYCTAVNATCPENSQCASSGPGSYQCLCLPGYHGYKCLRQGSFPTIAFSAGMVGSVLFLSGLLWITQRRNVKKQQ